MKTLNQFFMTTLVVLGCVLPQASTHFSSTLSAKTGKAKPSTINRFQMARVSQPKPRPYLQTTNILPPYQHTIMRLNNYDEIRRASGYHSRRLYSKNYLGGKLSPAFPVPSKGKVFPSKPFATVSTTQSFLNYGNFKVDNWKAFSGGKSLHLRNSDKPKFIPYIGARALANIPKIFEHLRENTDALHKARKGIVN